MAQPEAPLPQPANDRLASERLAGDQLFDERLANDVPVRSAGPCR
jgi:hypothetical protein